MNIGNTIRTLRRYKKYSQTDITIRTGITVGYLSKIEHGHKRPSMDVLESISKALNVPMPILFFMSLDEQDIDPSKQDMFKVLKPSIDELIKGFFIDSEL